MSLQEWSPVRYYGTNGTAPIVLICEHASFDFPNDIGTLGISTATRTSHAAGDIGALVMAKSLSRRLSAPLVFGGVSRLIYDCNRPLAANDAIPHRSEIHDIPGNQTLSDTDRLARHRLIHDPFHTAVDRLIQTQTDRAALPVTVITLHSFTPVYHGKRRELDIGFLFERFPLFSELAVAVEQTRGTYRAALNQPYDSMDGVTYSLAKHADDRGLQSTMIEVRNDLIDTAADADAMAAHLETTLRVALEHLHARNEVAQ